MNSRDEEVALGVLRLWWCLLILVDILIKECSKNNRRWWTKPFLHKDERLQFGAHTRIVRYFLLNDHEEFQRFVRMSVSQFNRLYEWVRPKLLKRSNREPLSPDLKLAAVLQ